MALTAWTARFGSSQGRAIPVNFPPPDGEWVFIMGEDRAGVYRFLNVGDYAEVSATGSFGGAEVLRFSGQLRGPTSPPAGVAFKASILVDGIERTSRLLEAGRTRGLIDMGACIARDTANHDLTFRMELVAT